ncbi:hypothetical protein TI05_05320 [Achromatium sp. WMS3]|nr:hypothetical protein TI05_05320 [Achromatium sp. WMS3]
MTNAITLDQALDTILQLPLEQQDMLIDILSKRQIETRRKEIITDANKSIAAFRTGQFKVQSAKEAIAELHQTIGDDE